MRPPWLTNQDFGSGKPWSKAKEDEFARYRQWLQSLDESSLAEYVERYPPPPGWDAFYLLFAGKIPPMRDGQHVDPKGKTLPPWLVYPDIPAGSIGWRMGSGEDYYLEFYRYYSRLSEEDATDYAREYPEPRGWHGKYAQIRANPWK